jgi:hypothetical protein
MLQQYDDQTWGQALECLCLKHFKLYFEVLGGTYSSEALVLMLMLKQNPTNSAASM